MISPVAKVAKILAQANSENPHEAAVALSLATDIMARFSISIADVERQVEPEVSIEITQSLEFWHEQVAFAVAVSRGCRVYRKPSGALEIRGKQDAASNAAKTYGTLVAECDRSREVRVDASRKRSFLRTLSPLFRDRFNYGFVAAVLARLTPLYADNQKPSAPGDGQDLASARRTSAERLRMENEAFLGRALQTVRDSGLDPTKVNAAAREIYDSAFDEGSAVGRRVDVGRWPPPTPPPARIHASRWLPEWGGPTKWSELDVGAKTTAVPFEKLVDPNPSRFQNLDLRGKK